MYHVRTVLEDEWQKRKENLGESVTLEVVFKKGIEQIEKDQAEERKMRNMPARRSESGIQ